jgi:hypothetical protein
MSGVILAPETTVGVASQQCANPKRTDDASTLTKDLLDVSLVPEITVQSVPDATSPPSFNQEVPFVFHHVPFRFSFDPPSDPASVSAFARAYPDLPGYHMWSTWDRLTAISTSGPAGSEEEDDPDVSWDFSRLRDPDAMRDFMSACDHCLSSCSDDGHSLDDEGCDPTRECYHIDQEDHDGENHLGMPGSDGALAPASRVEIPRELAVVQVPAGGQDTQLEQLREQEWAGQALAGGARHRARDVQRRIVDDARAGLAPAFSGAGQNLATAAMLLRTMPEPSTAEGRRIQGELKGLLEDATVRQAESSASRRRGDPSEDRATPSRCTREASVHTEPTRDEAPTARDRLGNDQHCRDRRAHLEEKVCRGYIPGAGDATTVRRIGVPRPSHQVRESSAGPYDERRSRPSSEPRPPSPSTQGRQGRSCGLRTTGWHASWEGRTTTTSSSATSPFSSLMLPGPGWSICLLRRTPTGTTWSRLSLEISRVRTYALGTHGISEAAASSQGNPCDITSGGFQRSTPSCPTSPTRTSSGHTSPAPLVETW